MREHPLARPSWRAPAPLPAASRRSRALPRSAQSGAGASRACAAPGPWRRRTYEAGWLQRPARRPASTGCRLVYRPAAPRCRPRAPRRPCKRFQSSRTTPRHHRTSCWAWAMPASAPARHASNGRRGACCRCRRALPCASCHSTRPMPCRPRSSQPAPRRQLPQVAAAAGCPSCKSCDSSCRRPESAGAAPPCSAATQLAACPARPGVTLSHHRTVPPHTD